MPGKAPSNNSPRTDDSLSPGRGMKEPVQVDPVAALVDNFLAAAYNVGSDANAEYEAALAALRKNANQVVMAISRTEASCPRGDYPRRWALIHAAAQLNHNAAFPFLRDVVAMPIPPERSTDPHSFSTVGEETVLRTTAVEGVGRLAGKGNKQALEALFEFLSIPSLSIRRAAVQSILARNPRLRKRVGDYVVFDERYLLDIVPKKVTEVPQIKNPERDLRRNRSPAVSKPVPPALSDDGNKKSVRRPRLEKGE